MRKTYIDNIRWITVIIVVIYHVIYMFNGVTTFGVIGSLSDNQPQDIFLYVVYPWFMLLLFVISGMSARFFLNNHSETEFIREKTQKLLVPSTIGVLVFGWILGYYNMLIGGALEQMAGVPKPIFFLILCFSGIGPLWYIQMLWLFCMILIGIRRIEKDRIYRLFEKTNVFFLLILTVLLHGASQILNAPVITVYRFGIYGLGFLIGYFVLSHDEIMDRIEKAWVAFSIPAVISGIIFVTMYYGKSYTDHEILTTLICDVYAWFGTLGILAFMKKHGDFENFFTKWMRKNAWGLYIFHYLPIAVSAYYLRYLAPGMTPVILYVLVGLAGFAGAYLLNTVILRIPVLRWCILGMRKELR